MSVNRENEVDQSNVALFSSAVKEAFFAEHRCLTDTAIGKVVGVSKPMISQCFKNPQDRAPKTIKKIASKIHSPDMRRKIVESWWHACFAGAESPAADPEGNALSRVASLKASGLPDRALAVAREALAEETDPAKRRYLMMQAIGLSFELDAAGDAAELAFELQALGREQGSQSMVVEGLAFAARAARRAGMADKEVQTLLESAAASAAATPDVLHGESPDMALARDLVDSERAELYIRRHERQGGQEKILGQLLGSATKRYESAQSDVGKARSKILETIILLALGNPFGAEEAFDEALKLSGKRTGTDAGIALLRGKILAARGDREAAAEHFRRLSEACRKKGQPYVGRMAQAELARLALG